MRNFIAAFLLCAGLLFAGTAYLAETARAQDDLVTALLNLPAPPPPNPLVRVSPLREQAFYDPMKPPRDDAPIEDLIDYWSRQSQSYATLRFNPTPSPRAAARLMAEIRSNPTEATQFLNIFRGDTDGARLIKDIHDTLPDDPDGTRSVLREWLVSNSPYFTDELEQRARRYGPSREYVTGHEDLVALAQHDWQRAQPIVMAAYNNPGEPTARVGAMWALYKNALQQDSIGDIDKYRGELMAIVEDRSATPGMRDLALDALVAEKEWSGRDDWYFSLLADETLADLRVNGQTYTGLTTLILYSPVERYKDRMIELVGSDNEVVRAAAARNLVSMLHRTNDTDILKALLPWLNDANWSGLNAVSERNTLIRKFATVKMPEAVPGLIRLLNEKGSEETDYVWGNANTGWASNTNAVSANAVNSFSNEPRTAANAMANVARATVREDSYPHRYAAISSLTNQEDMRAGPALRALLNSSEGYERSMVVAAMIASKAFTTEEQVNGLVLLARERAAREEGSESMNSASGYANTNATFATPIYESLPTLIGQQLANRDTVGDDVVNGVIARIETLERREPATASALRKIVEGWEGPAVSSMMLNDLKRGRSGNSAVLKLLAKRKQLQATHINNVFDLRQGVPAAVGLAGCLLEDANDMNAMLAGGNNEATAAMLACARLIRAPLEVQRVVPLLGSANKVLARAADLYLESEDSPEARAAILSHTPNTARITGASTAFFGSNEERTFDDSLFELYKSVSPYYASASYFGGAAYPGDHHAAEQAIQDELITTPELLGVYNYGASYVRIYADRAMFSIREDESRYRERPLTKDEFDGLKSLIAYHNAGDLPPFLSCPVSCESRQLLMVGRSGGRHVFAKTRTLPELFQGLEDFFASAKLSPMALKYDAGKSIPGLEVVFANDNLTVETVWKNGGDLRVLVTDLGVRERVKKEIADEIKRLSSIQSEEEIGSSRQWELAQELRTKSENEGITWRSIAGSSVSGSASTPPGFDIPAVPDALPMKPEYERWKTRAGDVEIRVGDGGEGLFKVQAGRAAKFKDGTFTDPVISTDGRWIMVNRHHDDSEPSLVVINAASGSETVVRLEEYGGELAIVYLPSISRFLIGSLSYSEYDDHYEATEDVGFGRVQYRPETFKLVDPARGTFREVPAGEFRPLTHQSFRQLQPTGRTNEYWAAIPDESRNETRVGFYDAGTFGFREVAKIPKIVFDSLDMWVDGGRIYFVYRGHLLSAPLMAN